MTSECNVTDFVSEGADSDKMDGAAEYSDEENKTKEEGEAFVVPFTRSK